MSIFHGSLEAATTNSNCKTRKHIYTTYSVSQFSSVGVYAELSIQCQYSMAH